MSDTIPLSNEELVRVVARGQFAREYLGDRISTLEQRQAELLAIIQEIQSDLAGERAKNVQLQQELSVAYGGKRDTAPPPDNGHTTPAQAGVRSG